jgi:hypothetical protein
MKEGLRGSSILPLENGDSAGVTAQKETEQRQYLEQPGY